MISPTKCRKYAAECRLLASSSDISAQRSLEQTIMALNWAALADQIDRDNARAASVAFSPLGGPCGVLKLGVPHSSASHGGRSRRLTGVSALLMARSAAATAAGLFVAFPITSKFATDVDHGQTPRSMP